MGKARLGEWWRKALIFVLVLALVLPASLVPAEARSKKRDEAPSLPIVRDAEIEGLLKLYSRPIFKAAGLDPKAIEVYIINDDSINAFVAEGQRLFINTGLLTKTKTPNEVIGVIAHETGHIAGGHLARLGIALQKASIQSIIGAMVGVAAMVGGAASGSDSAAQAGGGIIMGTQGVAQRNLLKYSRDMESSADQAALKYLTETHQSAKGMLDLFQRLANESIAMVDGADPYMMSHPMPLERISVLRKQAEKSPYYGVTDPPELVLRHKLMQAKLVGFLSPLATVKMRYPEQDKSMPARYARAIAYFRTGDLATALPIIDSLIKDLPSDPYFWELKGQAYLESGKPQEALAALKQATTLLPNSGLIQILYAQALIATDRPENSTQAITILKKAAQLEPNSIEVYSQSAVAYGQMGDIPRAELATAQAAFLQGDYKLAKDKAKNLIGQFKPGTPEWVRANDIMNFINKK